MKMYSLILCLVVVACSQLKSVSATSKKFNEIPVQADSLYKVYKIDSINSFYLIYAKRSDTLYKIVSKKETTEYKKDVVKIGNSYAFKLRSFLKERLKNNSTIPVPVNYLDVNCFAFDKDTNICLESGIPDLSFADNLKGLYYIKE